MICFLAFIAYFAVLALAWALCAAADRPVPTPKEETP